MKYRNEIAFALNKAVDLNDKELTAIEIFELWVKKYELEGFTFKIIPDYGIEVETRSPCGEFRTYEEWWAVMKESDETFLAFES